LVCYSVIALPEWVAVQRSALMSSSLQVVRRRPNPWWVGVVAGMASYIDAAAIVSSGIALVIYQAALGITPDQIGVLSAALTFCIAVGALVGGRFG
jgi:inositol transporter-like SP family MFS transporter